jgi:serine phosphatase RsbU (regulator of sigma subunit)/anti-sigma regulatory factor (Ser/Thr protein kinase)
MSTEVNRAREPEASFDEALTGSLRSLLGPLVAGVLAALALLTGVALLLVWRQYESAKDEAAAALETRAILAATVFDTYFAGQLTALSAIASSPTVVSGDPEAMAAYFARFRPGRRSTFTAGVGWIDLNGRQRATSDPRGPIDASLKDRTYFSEAVATRKPFVSEAIVARSTDRRLVVMSVPTRDSRGRLTGVLAGGIVLTQSSENERASDLGYAGLEVIDRDGQQVTRRDLARPVNASLLADFKKSKEGLLVDTRGLDGSGGRVVAYASSAAPGWTTVLDEPASTVFGTARATAFREASVIGTAAVIVLALLAWGLQRQRRELRAGRAQVVRWAQLTRSLNEAIDADAVRTLCASALASEFPDSSVAVAFEPAHGAVGHDVTVARGRRSSLPTLEDPTWMTVVLATSGSPVVRETSRDLQPDGSDALPDRVRSCYLISLLDETEHPVGAAGLFFASEKALAQHEIALVEAHVDQVSQALARIRRHEQEHDVAVALQQSLLPSGLPTVEGIEVAAYYRAGVVNTAVGGDWYDVVRSPDGRLHFTVGDVAGRGIEAAVLMGQLRNAFRAYALDNVSPALIIKLCARHVPEDGMATMVCVTFDPYTHKLTYASAGHLPPLLLDDESGVVSRLDPTRGGPLGWLSVEGTEEKELVVTPGTTLALYTDGLVERRGEDLDGRIDTLGRTIVEALTSDADDVVGGVVHRMVDAPVGDDLALLLVRIQEAPGTFDIELPAQRDLLRGLRHRVDTWLEQRGVEASARGAAVLALHEACINAIEHGYGNGPGTVAVTLEHDRNTLKIRVADNGSWRDSPSASDRGRGIVLMRGLMDASRIVKKPTGTEVLMEQRLGSS